MLLIDPGALDDEMTSVADELSDAGHTIEAGFSTHPHWDHVLWHSQLGSAPRYGTARHASIARDWLSGADDSTRVGMLPAHIADRVPLDLLGLITGLPSDAERIRWGSHQIRIIEHQAHAPAHAALLI